MTADLVYQQTKTKREINKIYPNFLKKKTIFYQKKKVSYSCPSTKNIFTTSHHFTLTFANSLSLITTLDQLLTIATWHTFQIQA